jgi:hypothetical protein
MYDKKIPTLEDFNLGHGEEYFQHLVKKILIAMIHEVLCEKPLRWKN